jgi:hypothetical protein
VSKPLPTQRYDFASISDDDDIDYDAACVFFGGSTKPISKVTLWRGMRDGRIPAANAFSRLNMGECRTAKARLKKKNRGPLAGASPDTETASAT